MHASLKFQGPIDTSDKVVVHLDWSAIRVPMPPFEISKQMALLPAWRQLRALILESGEPSQELIREGQLICNVLAGERPTLLIHEK
jgi:hypothetical protein